MTTLSLAEARANLSKLVDSAVTTHERFEVTRNGARAAVILSADDYDSLLETLDVLGDRDVVQALLDHRAHPEATAAASEVEAEMRRAGRLRS